MNKQILQGDAFEKLQEMDDNSIDCIITDPPYFLMDSSGKGFMGKDWDSVNSQNVHKWICRSKEFASFVSRFFKLMILDCDMVGENSAQSNVKMREQKPTKNNTDAKCVENNSLDTQHKSKVNINSVQAIVITGADLVDTLNGLSESHVQNVNQSVKKTALYVIPHTLLKRKLTGIVAESALKFPIENVCVVEEIHNTLMAEVKINAVIEGMIGSILENSCTNGMNGDAECVVKNVEGMKYKRITLSHIEKQRTIHWIIWLLYVMYVIQKLKKIPSKQDLHLSLMGEFFTPIFKECLRVLKSGAFACIMSAPRQDVLGKMISNLSDAGFDMEFTSIKWAYATGFPKAGNAYKIALKKIERQLKEKYNVGEVEWE